jgi:hypothetical protein
MRLVILKEADAKLQLGCAIKLGLTLKSVLVYFMYTNRPT